MLKRFFRSPIVITGLIITVAACFLFGPIFRGQVPLPTKSIPGLTWGAPSSATQPSIFRDRIVQAFPYHDFVATLIQHGHFPSWNNLIFAGTTFFANGQAGIFSLLKLPFWWMPSWLSYDIVTLLQSVIAGVGLALLARKLKWHPAAGVVAGLTLTLSAPFVMRMTVTTMSAVIACLPFVFVFVLRLHEQLTWKRLTVLAAALAIMILCGHVQLAAFSFGFAILWSLIWWRRDQWKRRAILFVLAFGLGLGLTAIQLVPVKESLDLAYRQPKTTASWMSVLNPVKLFKPSLYTAAASRTVLDQNWWGNESHYRGPANYLEGNLYLGPFAIFFMLFSVVLWRKKVWRWLAGVTFIISGFYVFPGWWNLVGKIAPWITVTPVWRTSFMLAFAVALLAGYGAHEFFQRRSKWAWPIVGVMLVTMLWQWWGILPFEPRSTLFPSDTLLTKAQQLTQDGSRVWTPNGALDQFMPYNIPVSVGYDSVYPATYLELWKANSASIQKLNQLVPINPNENVLRVTGSNVMITSDPVPTGWTEIMTEGNWHLAQRTSPTPSIHTVQYLLVSGNPASVAGINPDTEATINGNIPIVDANAQTAVRVLSQTPTSLTVNVVTNAPTALITNLQSYPGWKVKIDAMQSDSALLKVNYAFQGAAIPTGDHTVEFYYAPRSYVVGGILSIISLVLLIVGGWVFSKLTSSVKKNDHSV